MDAALQPSRDPDASLQSSSRRRSQRFCHGNLSVRMRRSGLLSRIRRAQVVDWLDYNRFGLAVACRKRMRTGTCLLLDLDIAEGEKIALQGVVGIVRNVQRDATGFYRCGIEFDLLANERMRRELHRGLARIESLLAAILQDLRRAREQHP